MRGDFSAWNKDRSHNFRGTLHQQGRVLLDRDWNAQTEIMGEWQETAARDAFGAGVAAVPAEVPLSFKVMKAEVTGGEVKLSLKKGRVWADGLLAELARDAEPPALPVNIDAIRKATYLTPPIQAPAGKVSDLPNGLTDAVILETWLEELSPFQDTGLLLEPALGGVDTTERVQTAFRFRLYRMKNGETCDSIIPNLKDKFDDKGKLTVELHPDTKTEGDCPVVEGGGYTGFEHHLYRIEIADTDRNDGSYFKWSQFNGGLVGTGDFDAVNHKVDLHGNRNAIIYSGLNGFYLEALDFDPAAGCWHVVYGAKVTLGTDGALVLPTLAADIFKGSIPPAPAKGKRFFRLWDGIKPISDFTAQKDLPGGMGILIKFEKEIAGTVKYTPSDFWTFEVRAGGIGNPLKLIDGLAPQGIFYHRVPLAEIHWNGSIAEKGDIEDCRQIFQPLTKQKTCCTYRVGDGIHSHGDFNKIQDAIDALPKQGGEVCILPGLYIENITIEKRRDVFLKGCGKRTVIRYKEVEIPEDSAVIHVRYAQGITIESLAVEAGKEGMGILLEGSEKTYDDKNYKEYLKDIILSELTVSAAANNAIKAYGAQFLTLRNSTVYIQDERARKVAVYLAGDDMSIERNEIRVLPRDEKDPFNQTTNDLDLLISARGARGGLQIAGGSERVRILNNLIVNGTGNGITLGSIDLEKDGVIIVTHDPPKTKPEDPCNPGDDHTGDDDTTEDGYVPVAGAPLYDIRIKFNRIFKMGQNGIGVATFFSMKELDGLKDPKLLETIEVRGIISVSKLTIDDNRIERCMNIDPKAIPEKMSPIMGYGGISLAHVENLVVRDNFISENGPSFLQPICGIFLLVVEGAEISRNHILNNGMQPWTNDAIMEGPRGGVWIAKALIPLISLGEIIYAVPNNPTAGTAPGIAPQIASGIAPGGGSNMPFESGVPAVKIQENIVSSPFGRSLTIFAQGPVSAVGNQLSSFKIPPVTADDLKIIFSGKKLTPADIFKLLNLLAGNVLIFDNGSAAYLPAQLNGFGEIRSGAAGNSMRKEMLDKSAPGSTAGTQAQAPAQVQTEAGSYEDGIRRFMANGTVLFTNNQCHQNLLLPGSGYAAASIFIGSLDDVGFHNNQCDCDFREFKILVDAVVLGMTVRMTDNYFREAFLNVLWSAVTIGIMNITSDNESIHCLLVWGLLYLKKYNLVMLEIPFGVVGDITRSDIGICDRMEGAVGNFGRGFAGSTTSDQDAIKANMITNIR